MSTVKFYFGPLADDALDAQLIPVLIALGGRPVRVIAKDVWVGVDSPIFSHWRPSQTSDQKTPFLCILPLERYVPTQWLKAERISIALMRSIQGVHSDSVDPNMESLFATWIPLHSKKKSSFQGPSGQHNWLGFNQSFIPTKQEKPWQILFLEAPEQMRALWQKNPHSLWTLADQSLQLQTLIAQSQVVVTRGSAVLPEILFALAASSQVLTDTIRPELSELNSPYLHIYKDLDINKLEEQITQLLAYLPSHKDEKQLARLEYKLVFGKLVDDFIASSALSSSRPTITALQAYQDYWIKKTSEKSQDKPKAAQPSFAKLSVQQQLGLRFRDRQSIHSAIDFALEHLTEPTQEIWWEGPMHGTQSLALVNQALIKALSDKTVGKIYPFPTEPMIHEFKSPSNSPSLVISHRYPPRLSLPEAAHCRWVNIIPWEYGAIPKEWLELKNADQIWVPSEFVKRAFRQAGFTQEQLRVLPNGVDTTVFCPQGESFPLATQAKFKFLFVGGLIERKGIDLLLTAFQQAFDSEDVCLVLKDWGSQSVYALDAYRRQLLEPRTHGPEILYLGDQELSTEQLAALYRSCDVYVHPYRGEGFGMPILEALACGLPVIVTDGGPATEFCPESASWFVRALPEFDPTLAGGAEKLVSTPWWFQPDLDSLVQALQQSWQAREQLEAKKTAARQAALNYDWRIIAQGYATAIQELLASEASCDTLTPSDTRSQAPQTALPFQANQIITSAKTRVLALCFAGEEPALKILLKAWAKAIKPEQELTLTLICLATDEEYLLNILSTQLEELNIDDCAAIELCPLTSHQVDADLLSQALACIQLESIPSSEWTLAAHLSLCAVISQGQTDALQAPWSLCLRAGDAEHLGWYLIQLISKDQKRQAEIQNYLKQVYSNAVIKST